MVQVLTAPVDGRRGRLDPRGERLLPPESEAEVKSQMRDRLATVNEEMVEGYVARRLVGASVEIAFASV